MSISQIVGLALVGLALMVAPTFGAQLPTSEDEVALRGIGLYLKDDARIPEINLGREMSFDQTMLDLECIKDPEFGSQEEVIELLTAFSINEREELRFAARLLEE